MTLSELSLKGISHFILFVWHIGVGISTVFEILRHFLFQAGWDHPVFIMVMIYSPSGVP
jgi:hypothetical protein